MPVDKFGRMSDPKTRDTGVSLTYINNNYVRSDGSTQVTGSIDMKGNTNVSDPVNPKDVATKEYADNKRTHIIAAHASYHGPLIEGKYQFTFGGNEAYDSTTGFLVPHSGRIRKIKMRTPINKESFENRVNERDRVDINFIDKGFFTFTRKQINGNFDLIGIIRCQDAYKLYFQDPRYPGTVKFAYDFCFKDDLPLIGEEGTIVREGDIINILTNIKLEFPPKLVEDHEYLINPYIRNTYLFTFLIELDPL